MNATLTTLGILLNDRPRALAAGTTLMELLREAGLAASKGVAAAVNGEVVPRSGWESRPLAQGDRVLVIRATQGG
jgi:sulfur carrier protein